MKRFLTCLLTLTMLLTLTAPAFADILWEPSSNQFYENHRDQCEYENRSYYANGKKGFVTVWYEPNGNAVRAQYENGETLWVGYTYKNWALISRWEKGKEISGWVPMKDLYLIYDHISFEEEYGDQFRDYNGEFANYTPQALGERFWLYEYPYDDEPKEKIIINQDMLDALRGTADQPSYISKVYTDRSGQDWGYVNYMYGIRNFWILLDNPTCNGVMCCTSKVDDLIYNGELIAPQEPVMPDLTARAWLPYILVGAVVVVTAGLLRKFWKKKE